MVTRGRGHAKGCTGGTLKCGRDGGPIHRQQGEACGWRVGRQQLGWRQRGGRERSRGHPALRLAHALNGQPGKTCGRPKQHGIRSCKAACL
eukprot:366369-Chlamydomonas_euryale.AAC.10